MRGKRVPVYGTDIDWILREIPDSTYYHLVGVVPRGERTEEFPYEEYFELPDPKKSEEKR